jgi:hypothetical protein
MIWHPMNSKNIFIIFKMFLRTSNKYILNFRK